MFRIEGHVGDHRVLLPCGVLPVPESECPDEGSLAHGDCITRGQKPPLAKQLPQLGPPQPQLAQLWLLG